MAKDSIKIDGLKQLTEDLKNIPFLKQAQILRNANRKAAKRVVIPILVRANPHNRKKFSKRSKKRPFGRDWRVPFLAHSEKGSKTAIRVGLASAFFHYRFAEFGTKPRTTYHRSRLFNRKTKKAHKRDSRVSTKLNRGKMPKTRPFINRILDKSISPLFRYLKTEYNKEVKKSIERHNRRK